MSGLLGWASDALKQWNDRQAAGSNSASNQPATKKRAASDDEDGAKRQRTQAGAARRATSGDSPTASRPAARAKKKQTSVLRTVQDLEGWLTEVSEEVDAQILQQSARNIIQLLKDSRTASNPTTFPHKVGAGINPLRPAMAFEEVLLQEGTTHVGKLVINLYRNKLCGELAQQLLAACIGGSEEQVERIDVQISGLLKPMEGGQLDETLVSILCKSIQTLQQRACLERTQLEALELKQQVEQARESLTEGGDHGGDAEAISERVDETVQLLDLQLEKFLPKLEEASSTFLFDGSQLDELLQEATQLQTFLSERKQVVDASLAKAKATLRDARKQRRQLLLTADEDEDASPRDGEQEHSEAFLTRMKSAEESRVAKQAAFEEQIKESIAAMEQLHTEQQEAVAREVAASQLQTFVESVKTVYAECTATEKVESDKEHRQLVTLYGQDVSGLCATMELHLTLHCKRVHHFHEQLAPKQAQLAKLKSLGLKKSEASINRTALENEIKECVELIEQSVNRVQTCKAKLTEHVRNFKTRQARLKVNDDDGVSDMEEGDDDDDEAALVPPAPASINGGHAGSFMATMSDDDTKQVRITVDGYGLTLHRKTSIIAFYDYRSIRSWDMSDNHFGITPSRLATATGQKDEHFKLQTTEGRAIAQMMNANAQLLVEQSAEEASDGSTLLAELLASYQAVADYCWLICAYCSGEGAKTVEGDAATTTLSYRGAMEDGLPHGEPVKRHPNQT